MKAETAPLTRKLYYDESNYKLIVATQQDIEPISRMCIEKQKQGRKANSFKNGAFTHVAEIPLVVVEMWKKEGVDLFNRNDWKEIKRRLNSPDYSYLRCWNGKI